MAGKSRCPACYGPGLIQPGSAAPAGIAGFFAGGMQLAVAAGREDPGTRPIMTLACLVITWIRVDGRDGLPGPSSPGEFLVQGTATYPAVNVISKAAPADPASR